MTPNVYSQTVQRHEETPKKYPCCGVAQSLAHHVGPPPRGPKQREAKDIKEEEHKEETSFPLSMTEVKTTERNPSSRAKIQGRPDSHYLEFQAMRVQQTMGERVRKMK